MTTNKTKKTAKKKTTVKKASAKKTPTKKASSPQTPILVRPEDNDRLSVQIPKNFVSAEKFMKSVVDEAKKPASVVRVNDVKSVSLRKKMLAWFKIKK